MLRPPFTLLLLKDDKRPVTIRVTGFSLVLAFCFVLLVGAAGAGLFRVLSPPVTADITVETKQEASAPEEVSRDMAIPEPVEQPSTGAPLIGGLSVTRQEGSGLEVDFSVTGIDGTSIVYVWLVANPGSPVPSETVLYPRSPMFRGLPVDYRNGIGMPGADTRHISITLGSELNDIRLDTMRILVYSSDGDLLADSSFSFSGPGEE